MPGIFSPRRKKEAFTFRSLRPSSSSFVQTGWGPSSKVRARNRFSPPGSSPPPPVLPPFPVPLSKVPSPASETGRADSPSDTQTFLSPPASLARFRASKRSTITIKNRIPVCLRNRFTSSTPLSHIYGTGWEDRRMISLDNKWERPSETAGTPLPSIYFLCLISSDICFSLRSSSASQAPFSPVSVPCHAF